MATMTGEHIWMGVGFVGQAFFGLRFVVQWIASERQKRSVVPLAFWYISVVGSVILFAYSVYLRNPVFIAGYSLNLLIYLRNLWIIFHPSPNRPAAQDGGPPVPGD
jgi:lipid-A-disaccharide synthase-like uncharacterized protein